MVIVLMGDSCVGKSTIAEHLKQKLQAEVFSGKDYLRLAKNENDAKALFKKKLSDAVTEEHVIYLVSEKEQLTFLPANCVKVLVTADIESIKRRFATRMHGNLPVPVASMLERKYGQFECESYDVRIDTEVITPEEACDTILQKLAGRCDE